MPAIPHKVTKKTCDMAYAAGQHGGAWIAFANDAGIDRQTADKYYRNTWLKGKNDQVIRWGKAYINMLELGIEKAKTGDVSEIMIVAKAIDNYLNKRGGDEWSTKQTIEQTNVNVEVPTTDYSKLSDEDKDTLIRIRLKAKG